MNIKVKIKGVAGLLQHRLNLEQDAASKRKKSVFNAEEEAIKAVYQDDNGYYVPSSWIEGMMVKSATDIKMPGSGKKTLKNATRGGVFVTDDKIRLSNKEYEVDVRAVVNPSTRGRILRARPLFKEWELEFTLSVINEKDFDVHTIKEILDNGGQYVGIGDYRPKYGRFVVIDCEQIK